MTHTSRTGNVDVDAVALGIGKVSPPLDLFEQRLSLELYRLLSGGQPVARAVLAERVFGLSSGRRIVGYWGLSITAAFKSPHQLMIDGPRLV